MNDMHQKYFSYIQEQHTKIYNFFYIQTINKNLKKFIYINCIFITIGWDSSFKNIF